LGGTEGEASKSMKLLRRKCKKKTAKNNPLLSGDGDKKSRILIERAHHALSKSRRGTMEEAQGSI